MPVHAAALAISSCSRNKRKANILNKRRYGKVGIPILYTVEHIRDRDDMRGGEVEHSARLTKMFPLTAFKFALFINCTS